MKEPSELDGLKTQNATFEAEKKWMNTELGKVSEETREHEEP